MFLLLIFPRFHPSTGLFVPNLMSTRVAAQEPPGGATNPKVNDDRGEDPKGEGRSIASPIFNWGFFSKKIEIFSPTKWKSLVKIMDCFPYQF